MDNTSSLKAILFFVFQTIQKMQTGPALQTNLKKPFQPNRVSLTEDKNTQDTLKRVKNNSHTALFFSQWRRRWSMDSSSAWQR